ncbi:hypothetical protein ALC60_10659 [Trachymyrmex zeteki]|uniref:Uncharacterized protein n=1 Tax=Mycetomoellerius zeteki TaxID=64791 RepID=A0A151WR68_9HYME|nr:hypothetical protein ALC60_10659 [Trachymyrmex zeteki]
MIRTESVGDDLGLSGPVVAAFESYWPAKSQVVFDAFETSLLRQLWGFYAACASTRNERNALGNPKGVQRIATAWRMIYWTHRFCIIQQPGSA